jgi:hypothetical protein
MDGWMDGATGGVTRQVQYFFDDTQGIFAQEFSTKRKTKDISRDLSIHPTIPRKTSGNS